jgi:hypothetical protein
MVTPADDHALVRPWITVVEPEAFRLEDHLIACSRRQYGLVPIRTHVEHDPDLVAGRRPVK